MLYSHCGIEFIAINMINLQLTVRPSCETDPRFCSNWLSTEKYCWLTFNRCIGQSIGLLTFTLVYGYLHWSTDTYIGLRTLTLVYGHLHWSTDTYTGLRTLKI